MAANSWPSTKRRVPKKYLAISRPEYLSVAPQSASPSSRLRYPELEDRFVEMEHQSHPAIIMRLKRAEGHLRSLIGMIEAGRPCLDLAQQLHAIEKAVANAKHELIHDHIDHCLHDAVDGNGKTARAALAEFKALTKYL